MKKIKRVIVEFRLLNAISILFYIFRIFKIKTNKIICTNFSGKGYGDSPKYITEKLIDNKRYDIVWAVKNTNDVKFPEGVRLVKIYSIKYIYELATSKIWINNSRFDVFVRKRKNQFYIQTWHSPLRLKKIEMDAIDNLSDYYKQVMKNDSKMIDVMMSGCDFSYNIYRNSFLYNGDILKIGTPRCDLFFDKLKINTIKNEILTKYNIDQNSHIIMYAPTFRINKDKDEYVMNYKKVIENLPDNFVLLVRFHPRNNFEIDENKRIINVSNYPDMQELVCACDFLITDYSSCCFDMLIANKPCILFVKDIDDYLREERNLYFEIDELPFYQSKNENEIINLIKNFDYDDYKNKTDLFKKEINLYENGTASDNIVKLIEGMCSNEKI